MAFWPCVVKLSDYYFYSPAFFVVQNSTVRLLLIYINITVLTFFSVTLDQCCGPCRLNLTVGDLECSGKTGTYY